MEPATTPHAVNGLKSLLRIAGLSTMEVDAPRVSLAPGPPFTATYEGIHSGGVAQDGNLAITGLSAPVGVDVRVLREALELVGTDGATKMKWAGSALQITGPSATLKVRTGDGFELPTQRIPKGAPSAVFNVDILAGAVRFLSDIASAKLASPVLTGIHMVASDEGGGLMMLTATDGVCAGVVGLPANVRGGAIDVVVPAADLLASLGALVSERAALRWDGKGIVELVDPQTFVRMSLLAGKYPDISVLPADGYRAALSLPTAAVASAVRAASLLDPEGLVVTFGHAKGRLYLSARGQELGSYLGDVGSGGDAPEFTMPLDGGALKRVALIGDEALVIHLAHPDNPHVVMMESGQGWRYWQMQVATA